MGQDKQRTDNEWQNDESNEDERQDNCDHQTDEQDEMEKHGDECQQTLSTEDGITDENEQTNPVQPMESPVSLTEEQFAELAQEIDPNDNSISNLMNNAAEWPE